MDWHHEAGGQDQEFINESVYVKETFGFASPSEVLIITLLTEMRHQQHGGEHLSRLHCIHTQSLSDDGPICGSSFYMWGQAGCPDPHRANLDTGLNIEDTCVGMVQEKVAEQVTGVLG